MEKFSVEGARGGGDYAQGDPAGAGRWEIWTPVRDGSSWAEKRITAIPKAKWREHSYEIGRQCKLLFSVGFVQIHLVSLFFAAWSGATCRTHMRMRHAAVRALSRRVSSWHLDVHAVYTRRR